MTLFYFCTLILFYLFSANAEAATYGVANESCTTTGTQLTSTGGWEAALEGAAPGTTFLLRNTSGATFTSSNFIAITAANITVKPYNCQAISVVGQWRIAAATDNLTIAGLSIDDVLTTAAGGNNVTIRNNVMRGGSNSAIRVRHAITGWTVSGNDADTLNGSANCVTATLDFDLGSTTHVLTTLTISGNRIRNTTCEDGLIINRWGVGVVIQDNVFPAGALGDPNADNLIDIKAPVAATSTLLVRGNILLDRGLTTASSITIHGTPTFSLWPVGASCVIENNIIEDSFRLARNGDSVDYGGPCIFRKNTFRGIGAGVELFGVSGANTNNQFYNNVFYNGSFNIPGASSGNIIRNNIFHTVTYSAAAADIATCSHNVNYNGTGTFPTNCTSTQTGDPLLVSPSTGDFTISAGTGSGVNNGVAGLIGIVCNNACDIGRYETINSPAATCVVENATPNRVDVTFTNNAAPPIQTGAVTGINVLVAGAGRVESAPTVNGTNIIQYTIDGAAVTAGQTVTWEALSTNLITDSSAGTAGLGTNQKLHVVAPKTCTNNVTVSATYVFNQPFYRTYRVPLLSGVLVPLTTDVSKPAKVNTGSSIVIAAQITATVAAAPEIGSKWQYNLNGGGWVDVPDAFGVGNVKFAGSTFDGPAYPQQGFVMATLLDATGLTTVEGSLQSTSAAVPTFQLNQNAGITLAAMFTFDTDTVAGTDQYQFRMINQDGTTFAGTIVPAVVDIINFGANSL